MTVYDLPEDTNSNEYKKKVKILLWYSDWFLPMTAGLEFYSTNIRHYQRATAGVTIWGKKTKHITLHDEAMACLLYENCLPKWKLIVPKRAENPKWNIPQGKEHKKYRETKYSDPNSGQVRGRGWKNEGYDAFIQHCERIQEIRATDRKNGHTLYKFCLDLMRKDNEVTATRAVVNATARRDKRKHSPKKAAPVTPMKKIEEEVHESDYTEHSEDSSGEADHHVEGDE